MARALDGLDQFTLEVLVAGLETVPDDLVRVLIGVADEHQRHLRIGQPAQPGGKRRAQSYRK